MICRAIPFEGKEPYFFVSYCHGDKEQLYPLFEQMAMDGYRLWYDDGNHVGEDWVENIENHLENCKVCLAFISERSSLSHNCKSEIVYALKCKKKIIPILIEDTDLPKGLRLQLGYLHYLKRSDFPSDRAMLERIYASEECKECKASGGRTMLRPVSESESPQLPENAASDGGVLSGLSPAQIRCTPAKAEPEQANLPNFHKKKRIVGLRMVGKKEKLQEPPVDDAPAKDVSLSNSLESNDEEQTVLMSNLSVPDDDEGTIRMNNDDDADKTVCENNWKTALLVYPAENRAYILRKPQTKLGRSSIICDVSIEGNVSISKHHADIIQYNQMCYLLDAGSTNGTFLNGERLEANERVALGNPAVFQMNNETFVLLNGNLANYMIKQGKAAFLMNEGETAVRVIDDRITPLNRKNRWPDGTLSDLEVHRAAHASIYRADNDFFLKDEDSENGTYHNDVRLKRGMSIPLSSGDRITLGKTTLKFYSIAL